MAITFSKEPSGIYPAYNDSFIEFTSSLANHKRAEITAYPLDVFTKTFPIYPDTQGNYFFNLKEIVKSILNTGFEDKVSTGANWSTSFVLGYLLQTISIEVFSDAGNETITRNYEFFKSIKQIGEDIYPNKFQLLSSTPNGIDHNLKYWEGFPFFFDILKVDYAAGKEITLKSLNTSDQSTPFAPTVTGSFRIQIDKGGGDNWTADNVLPLITGLNHLHLLENGNFKANVDIWKHKKCSGVYLKWFNNQGGYSFWLFDQFSKEVIRSNNLDVISSNDFNNVGQSGSSVLSFGKSGDRAIRLRTLYAERDKELLQGLFTSPFVQMYTSREANVLGKFITVQVEDVFEFKNKQANNEVALTIDLPEVLTIKY